MTTPIPDIPAVRLTPCNTRPERSERAYVLYWMIAQRRLEESFALQRAAHCAQRMGLPLVIFEPLRAAYPHASDRLTRFILDGMRDHHARLVSLPHITYYPYVEPTHGAASGLLHALATRAALIVTDDFPCLFLPRMVEAAAAHVDVRMERVDGNGLLPLRAAERVYTTAYSFRRGLHKMLPQHLEATPMRDPLAALDPSVRLDLAALDAARERWPATPRALLHDRSAATLAHLPIDHSVTIAPLEGGERAALERAEQFVGKKLGRYPEDRNDPDANGSSGLSPYLHFGYIGAHTLLRLIAAREGWTPQDISDKPTGQREGWWNMSPAAEAFLDELITWREIGLNMAHHAPQTYNTYASIPDFARTTLNEHRDDPRETLYSLEELKQAKTHDELWNAAQRQLTTEGIMHNYMRMLWGKKIIEWSASPEEAAERMILLNDKYALDGRDPSSYSGIFWCLGRYDRGWTERPIFGKVRYMSSDNTRRKLKLTAYLKRYSQKP